LTVVKLSQVDPTWYPFDYKIGDRVRSAIGSREVGTVIEGFHQSSRSSAFSITYQIKKDDGLFFDAKQEELEPAK